MIIMFYSLILLLTTYHTTSNHAFANCWVLLFMLYTVLASNIIQY